MTFTHPWVLLLLAVPVVLLWTVVGRGTGLVLPFDHQSHPRRRWLASVLGAWDTVPLLLLAVAILVLAGPQALQHPKPERLLTNIQICMDVSGSMEGDRYQMASRAITDFTKAREGDAFGLTLFGDNQIRWIPITRDLNIIRSAMPFANPEHQPEHMLGTRIGAALRYARDTMESEAKEGDRLIILVSDGYSLDVMGGKQYEVARELRDARITLYYIHVAEDEAITAEVAELAALTGGEALQGADPETLGHIFTHIDRMKPAKFRSLGMAPMDQFRPFSLAALVLVGVHLVGLLGLRYTPW